MSDKTLDYLVERTRLGDRKALEQLVKHLQGPIYGMSIRFLGHPEDASDAAQEILLRIVTNLSSFKGESQFKTWAYRLAKNQLLNFRRSLKRREFPIEEAEEQLKQAVAASRDMPSAEDDLIVEEMKLSCAHGMLLCLDRDHRMAYILGVLLEMPGKMAAEILEISSDAYRKRLQRSRSRMRTFFNPQCGLIADAHPCKCSRMVGVGTQAGIIDTERLPYTTARNRTRRLHDASNQLLETTEVLAGLGIYDPPNTFIDTMKDLLSGISEFNVE